MPTPAIGLCAPYYDGDRDEFLIKNTGSRDEIQTVQFYNEIMDTDLIADLRRQGRKSRAEQFRHDYIYGPTKELKTCIWAGGSTHSWPDKSSGIIWVGVLGMNSACVVTRAGFLDVTRSKCSYKYETKEMVLRHFRESAIAEMEDFVLEEPPSELRELFGQSFKRPFAVVSGIQCIDEVDTKCNDEASSDEYDLSLGYDDSIWKQILEEVNSSRPPREYDATKLIGVIQEQMKSDPSSFVDKTLEASSVECDENTAVEYLKGAMSCGTTFNVEETIQVALIAFQLLFKKNFEAEEIEVSVVDPNYRITWKEAQRTDKHCSLWELETSDIEKYLAPINNEPDCLDAFPEGDRDTYDKMYAAEYTWSDDEIKTVQSRNQITEADLIVHRQGRKRRAEQFRHDYIYGPSKEQKTCIWSGGSIHSWLDKYSGIIWVGVHGMNSACVVTWAGYLDVNCKTKEMVLYHFMEAAISELEDLELEEPLSELHEKFGQSFRRPFTVVSGIPCIDEADIECGHEPASSVECVKTAVEFLKRRMSRGAAFTVDETIQTAISAFQHLFQKRFKANEIKVIVTEYKNPFAKDLVINDIKEHLAIINRPGFENINCKGDLSLTAIKTFSTAIVGVCCGVNYGEGKLGIGVLVVDSHVSNEVDGELEVSDRDYVKVVNIFDRVYLTATGYRRLLDQVKKRINNMVTTAISMEDAAIRVTEAINEILAPSEPNSPLKHYEDTLFVLLGVIGLSYRAYKIRFNDGEYVWERILDSIFYFGSGEGDIRKRLQEDPDMRDAEAGATRNHELAFSYAFKCVKHAIEKGGGRCGGSIRAVVLTEDINKVPGGYQRPFYKWQTRLGKSGYYLVSK